MIRKLQLLAMVLFLSTLMAASAQAAPARTVVPKTTPEVGFCAEVWKLLSPWLRGQPLFHPSSLRTPDISSQLDPNGQH
jgi:hypothetical protein